MTILFGVYLVLWLFFDLLCNVWVCFVMFGVCMGFIMCRCVYVCVLQCVGVLVTCVLVYTVFCIVRTVFFVLFHVCIFILICFVPY